MLQVVASKNSKVYIENINENNRKNLRHLATNPFKGLGSLVFTGFLAIYSVYPQQSL